MKINKQKLYERTWFKNTILITIPTIISVLGIFVSLFPEASKQIKDTLVAIIILLIGVLIVFVLFFSNNEDKMYNDYIKVSEDNAKLVGIIGILENQLKTSVYTITTFSQIFEKWSQNINIFADNIEKKNKVSNRAWNREKYFDNICLQCKNMIKQYCDNQDDSKVLVGFVICRENERGEKTVHMIAHSDPVSTRPSACKMEQTLSECSYHYGELVRDEYEDIEVAVTNEEVQRLFHRVSKHTELSKYSQYIAIPVYSTKSKMLGVFQIVTKYNYIIERDAIKLREFAMERIIPYANMVVLVEMISKGLYTNSGVLRLEESYGEEKKKAN